MKVAVCVSGAFVTKDKHGDLRKNNKILKLKFPNADFHYATWSQYKDAFSSTFPDDKCLFLEEPKPHYHPYLDIPKEKHISTHYQTTVQWVQKGGPERIEWTSHHTKQLLAHNWLLETMQSQYDVIVRTRFDAFVSKHATFDAYIQDSFKHKRANGFGATRPNNFDAIAEANKKTHPLHSHWIVDPIIIHPATIDTQATNNLYKDRRLHAAEFGWYQILSLPFGSTHRNHLGWVNADVRVLDQFKWSP